MSGGFFLLTGCSGGGKSTVLQALADRGFATVPEPGRRVVREAEAGDGSALPWVDMAAFARRALDMAHTDLIAAQRLDPPVFFDRGVVDAAVALAHAGGPPIAETLGEVHAYANPVFVVPPWQAIFSKDAERRHGFEAAVEEYHRINKALDALGYERQEFPCLPVKARVEAILKTCLLT